MVRKPAASLLSSALLAWSLFQVAPAEPAPTPSMTPTPAPTSSATPRPLSLTLSEAVRIALAKSPKVGLALAKVRQSVAETDEIAAQARLHATATVTGPPPPAGLTVLSQNLAFSPFKLEARQLLADGGRVAAKLDQSKALADKDAKQAVADWHKLNLDVSLAYLDTLRARAHQEVVAQSLDLADKQLVLAERRFQAGDAPKGDVLLARVPKAQAELEVAEAAEASHDKEEALNLLIGLPLNTPLELSPPDPPPPLEKDLDQCLAQADKSRPLVLASRSGLKAAEHGVIAAQRDNAPQVNLTAGVFTFSSAEHYINQIGPSIGVEISAPFLDGGYSKSLTKAAKAARDQAFYKLDDVVRQTEGDIRLAYRAMEVAKLAESTSEVAEEQAVDAYRVATAQYKAGMVTFYPMNEAEHDLTKARVKKNGAHFDFLAARFKLDYARGEDPKPNLIVPPLP